VMRGLLTLEKMNARQFQQYEHVCWSLEEIERLKKEGNKEN